MRPGGAGPGPSEPCPARPARNGFPSTPIGVLRFHSLQGPVAQTGSAPRSHRGGQGFKSPQVHNRSEPLSERSGRGFVVPCGSEVRVAAKYVQQLISIGPSSCRPSFRRALRVASDGRCAGHAVVRLGSTDAGEEREHIELPGTIYEQVPHDQRVSVRRTPDSDVQVRIVAPVTNRGDAIGLLEVLPPQAPASPRTRNCADGRRRGSPCAPRPAASALTPVTSFRSGGPVTIFRIRSDTALSVQHHGDRLLYRLGDGPLLADALCLRRRSSRCRERCPGDTRCGRHRSPRSAVARKSVRDGLRAPDRP